MYGEWEKTGQVGGSEMVAASAVDAVVGFVDAIIVAENDAVAVAVAWVNEVAWHDEITGKKEMWNEVLLLAMQDGEMQSVKVECAVGTVRRCDIHNIRCSCCRQTN